MVRGTVMASASAGFMLRPSGTPPEPSSDTATKNAMYAPTMKMSPWAKLMSRSTP